MEESEKLALVKTLTGETDETLLSAYLNLAESKVYGKLYPFGLGTEKIPARYDQTEINIAVYLYEKRGAEGEISHSENGVSRSYGDSDVPESMLKGIVPFAAVPSDGTTTS